LSVADKQAFFVFGPESSGNHLTCEILKRCGCFWEDEFPIEKICRRSDLVVFRRSVPHGACFDDPAIHMKQFHQQGFEVKTIIPTREWTATVLSNYFHRYPTIHEAMRSLIKAHNHIWENIKKLYPFWLFNTSFLFKRPREAVKTLELFTGLTYRGSVDWIYDADKKHHELLMEKNDLYSITKAVMRNKLRL